MADGTEPCKVQTASHFALDRQQCDGQMGMQQVHSQGAWTNVLLTMAMNRYWISDHGHEQLWQTHVKGEMPRHLRSAATARPCCKMPAGCHQRSQAAGDGS